MNESDGRAVRRQSAGIPGTGRPAILAAAVLLCSSPLLCTTSVAQEYDSQTAQEEPNPLTLSAGLGLIHDSNVVRLPGGYDPGISGAESRRDTMVRGELGLRFDRRFSRQRLTVDGLVDGYKYFSNSSFDNIGYNGGVNLDYEVGRALFGRVGFRVSSFEPMIQDRRDGSGDRNKIQSQFLYWQGGLRLTSDWALIAGADFDRRRNTVDLYKDQDLDRTSWEVGTRYMRGAASFFDLVWRHTNGDYQNEVATSVTGVPLATGPINRKYKQDSFLLRTEYRPNEQSRVAGQVGWTKRRTESDQIPDFNGLTMGADVDWALSGLTTVRLSLSRGVEPVDYSSVGGLTESTSFALRPSIRATNLITVTPYYVFRNIKYRGVGGIGDDRRDRLHTFGVGGDYAFRRSMSFWGDLRQERRNSSDDAYRFTANIISAGVRVRF